MKPDVRSSAISGRLEPELLSLKNSRSSRAGERYFYGSEFMQLEVTPQVQR